MTRYVIGVDSGGTFIKAGLYDEDGALRAIEREPSRTTAHPDGRVEIDLDELWRAVARCVRSLVHGSGIDPVDLAGIGFAGQGKGLYAIDAGGDPVGPAITSADNRAEPQVRRWRANGSAARVSALTLQGVYSSHPVSILAWLKENDPDAYRRIRWVLSMKDYLVHRATGVVASDFGIQSGNSFVNLRTRSYDAEILDLLGLPELMPALPPLVDATDVVGVLTPGAAEELGCAAGTPVISGMFDVHAAAVAAGLVDESAICMITGTAGVNVYAATEPVADGSVAMNSLYCLPGLVLVEEGSNSSIGGLGRVVDDLYATEGQAAEAAGTSRFAAVERVAAAVAPEDGDVVYLPYAAGDEGLGSARASWVGIGPATGRDHLLRAAYEGFAFAHRRHVDRLTASRGGPAVLRVAGGGASSPLFVQILADVLGAPVHVMPEAELGVRGVAMATGVAVGLCPSLAEAVERSSPGARTVAPDPATAATYERKYARFTRTVEALRTLSDPL